MLKDELIVSLEQEKQQPTSIVLRAKMRLNPYSRTSYASMTIDEEIELIKQTMFRSYAKFYHTFMHSIPLTVQSWETSASK